MFSRNMLVEKVTELRSGRNQVVGLFVGKLHKGRIIAGWSRCKPNSGDEFDLRKGVQFAINNAIAMKHIPNRASTKEFQAKYSVFCKRCLCYFKTFDFNGRTTIVHSKKSLGLGKKDFAPVPVPKNQLGAMGISEKDIDNFFLGAMPVLTALKAKGCTGFAVPLTAGFTHDMAQKVQEVMQNAVGVPVQV